MATATPMVVLPTKMRIEKTPEEILFTNYPAKFVERPKVTFVFENKTHKFFRMDFYNTANDNRIDRSYFIQMDKTTNIPVRIDYRAD